MNVMCCTAQQPGVSLSCQCCSRECWHCCSWKCRISISRCFFMSLWIWLTKFFPLRAEHYCRNDACIAFVLYNIVPLVFPFSLIFFFLSFHDKCFCRGFHRKQQINQRGEIGMNNFYFTEYLCAIPHLVNYSGIACFNLKNNMLAVIIYFQKEIHNMKYLKVFDCSLIYLYSDITVRSIFFFRNNFLKSLQDDYTVCSCIG